MKRLNLITLTLTAALLAGTAMHAQTVMLGTDGSLQIEAELKAHFEEVGLVYPADQDLTFGQVEELLVVFDRPDTTKGEPTADEKAAKAHDATLILSRINTEMDLTHNNLGAIQIEDELKARMAEVGLAPPNLQALTVSQIRELLDLFKNAYKSAANPTEDEKVKVAADANMVLSRIANPVAAGDNSAAVQVLKDELKLNMEKVGLEYPADKNLTLNQVVALGAVFSAPDEPEVKSASDPDAARAKFQAAAITAMLGQM